MKPTAAPKVPGDTEWERFDNAVRAVLTVPKEAVLKEDAKRKRRKKRAKKHKNPGPLTKP